MTRASYTHLIEDCIDCRFNFQTEYQLAANWRLRLICKLVYFIAPAFEILDRKSKLHKHNLHQFDDIC